MIEMPPLQFAETNGIRMGFYEAGPKTDTPPVVLCHGWPELAFSWRHQIKALGEAGIRVIAPDQRGYGATDRPEPVEAYDMEHLTGDLVGLLDHLKIDKAIFVGHDWGAVIGWGVAAVMGELQEAGLLNDGAMTVTGRTAGENVAGWRSTDHAVIRPVSDPLRERAGFLVLSGNLFDSALMKTSVISPEADGRWLEYAGGYSDMLAQKRGATKEAARPAKAREQRDAKPEAKASTGPAKLSFKQKYALESLPKEMAALEAAIAAAEAEMADPNLFNRAPDRFNKLAAIIDEKRAALASAEDQWLELEMLKAELEG